MDKGGYQEGKGNGDDSEDEDGDMVSEAQELQDLIQIAEESDRSSLSRLAEAVALVTTDDFMRVYVSQFRPNPELRN